MLRISQVQRSSTVFTRGIWKSHLWTLSSLKNLPLDIHPEVQEALASKKPIVALETTVITHGFPYPNNFELGIRLEEIVRAGGATPATIGILGGRVKIGLSRSDFGILADKKHNPAVKVSRRDIGPAIATKSNGGTTCSATLVFSALAGIKVFSTGGLGGVHRGAENSMDISADLLELSRSPVGLVSSGVKSILDIGRTLEYLETAGVPVLSYGPTKEFPAFFTRRSGFHVPWNVGSAAAAATILYTQEQFKLSHGALIAVPIPEEFEADGDSIQRAIDQAISESVANGVSQRGNEATPWLLARIAELTNGASVLANRALLENTARVGAEIAVEYTKLANKDDNVPEKVDVSEIHLLNEYPPQSSVTALVVGSAAVDITAQAYPSETSSAFSTAPGHVSVSLGGVARNIAEASHRTMHPSTESTLLVSPVGRDPFGTLLLDETKKLGMRIDGLVHTEFSTSVCNMVLDSQGNLASGVADMKNTAEFSPTPIIEQIDKHNPTMVAVDGNLSPGTLEAVVGHCNGRNIHVLFEPTSIAKSTAILPALAHALKKPHGPRSPLAVCTPNLRELAEIYQTAKDGPLDLFSLPGWWSVIEGLNLGSQFRLELEHLSRRSLSDENPSHGNLSFLVSTGVAQMAIHLLPLFQNLVVKCGDKGVFLVLRVTNPTSPWHKEQGNTCRRCIIARGNLGNLVVLRHFPSLEVPRIKNVTGAGDSFVGTLLTYLSRNPHAFENPAALTPIVNDAQRAASLTLQSDAAVSPLLSRLTKA